MILCIETATPVCSVALCDSAGVISLRESRENKSHAAQLTVYIEELLKEQNIPVSGLQAIAVSKGPGSYTGLRIGVSAAKGLAYPASVPLIGIETTKSMFRGIKNEAIKKYDLNSKSLFCPMLDARRMEVYYCLYDREGNTVKNISASIIDNDTFAGYPDSVTIVFFGDGAEKCRDIIDRKNSVFADYMISASHMQAPAYEAFNAGSFEDIAYFEPFYLKDFIATVPRKNIFGN
jgi:tRNA threonylcarbamoyladenosine biosynthesis protein TsaB